MTKIVFSAALALTLGACSSAGPETAAETTPAAATATPAASNTPTVPPPYAEAAEPTTLEEAVDHAYAYQDEGMAVIEKLYPFAKEQLMPEISAERWGEIDLIRMRASLDALSGDLTDEELRLAVFTYATNVDMEAGAAGVYDKS